MITRSTCFILRLRFGPMSQANLAEMYTEIHSTTMSPCSNNTSIENCSLSFAILAKAWLSLDLFDIVPLL